MARIRPASTAWSPCFITEVVMTMMFLFVIMGATHGKAPAGFAPLAIGLALVMIHLVSIPVTNTSVNPARSTGPALFVGGWALAQLWLFWVAPLIGGALGGVIYRWLSEEPAGVVDGPQDGLKRHAAARYFLLAATTSRDMAHLAAGARRALAVEVHGGAGHGQPFLVVVDVVADQIGHGDRRRGGPACRAASRQWRGCAARTARPRRRRASSARNCARAARSR